MKLLLKFIEKLENFGAFLAALAMGLMFGLGLAEILSREGLGTSISISLEYTGYLVALSFLMGSGWTFRQGKHVRLTLWSPPEGLGKILEITVLFITLGLVGLLSFGLISWAFGSFAQGSVSFFPSATPLWIPQTILSLGPIILGFSILGRLIEALRGEKPWLGPD